MRNTDLDHIRSAIKICKIWSKFCWVIRSSGFEKMKKPYVAAQGNLLETYTHQPRNSFNRRKH